jgi:hypothetical protein
MTRFPATKFMSDPIQEQETAAKLVDNSISEFIRLGLTKDMLRRLRAISRQQRISVNKLIRNAVEQYLPIAAPSSKSGN